MRFQRILLGTLLLVFLSHGDLIANAQSALPKDSMLSSPYTNSLTTLNENFSVSSGSSTNLFSEPAKIMGHYNWNGQTVMPFAGLGFTRGESTDVNRTIIQEDRVLRDPLSRTIMPNQFHLGQRFPF